MFERYQTDDFDPEAPESPPTFTPLPGWLADRLLRDDEKITWVCGPKFTPSWERYVTHPGLFVVALALGAVFVGAGFLFAGPGSPVLVGLAVAAGAIVLASIFVLAIFAAYFTRLVVTNFRLVILQGYEICRSWGLDDLPPSLIRYRPRSGDEESRTIDLAALKTMLSGPSNGIIDSKTILAFGERLKRNKSRDTGPP